MPLPTPDFRKMSIEEIKHNISQLNTVVRELSDFFKGSKKQLYLIGGIGTAAAMGGAVAFPPAAPLLAFCAAVMAAEGTAQSAVAKKLLEDSVELRAKFKAVYRARPGRKQFNLAARKKREADRPVKVRYYRYYGGF